MKYVLLVFLMATAACRAGGSSGDDTGTIPTPTTTDATFIPDLFGILEARFALQEDGRIGPTADGTWSITLELVSEAGEVCDAIFEGTQPQSQAVFSATENVFARAARPDGLPEGTCSAADLPEPWADPMALLDLWDFAVGVTGAPTDDILNTLDPDDLEALEPYLFGGGVYLPGFDGDGDGNADQQPWRPVAIAWSEDAAGNLVPYQDRVEDGELLPGTYVVQPRQYFSPARALLRPAD